MLDLQWMLRVSNVEISARGLTLLSLWGGQVITPVQRWGRIISAKCAAPNLTEGHISPLVVFVNQIRDIGWTLFSSYVWNIDPEIKQGMSARGIH